MVRLARPSYESSTGWRWPILPRPSGEKRRAGATLEDGLKSLEIILAAEESRAGSPPSLPFNSPYSLRMRILLMIDWNRGRGGAEAHALRCVTLSEAAGDQVCL